MSWKRLIPAVIGALCVAGSGVAAENVAAWAKLKAGMTPIETKAALGDPLLKNRGRGFELWMYDSGAEVVCFLGVLVAWTGPEGHRTSDGQKIDLTGIKINPVPSSRPEKVGQKELDYGFEELIPRTFRLPKL